MESKFRELKVQTKYRTRKYDKTKIPEIRLLLFIFRRPNESHQVKKQPALPLKFS